VHRLLRIKPVDNITRYEWIAFFYLTFWTTFAPLVLFLQILLENLFEVFFANSLFGMMDPSSSSIFENTHPI
jgi:hypothetical protein